jgi:hypothetical protein
MFSVNGDAVIGRQQGREVAGSETLACLVGVYRAAAAGVLCPPGFVAAPVTVFGVIGRLPRSGYWPASGADPP